jgi:hypothetical protein
MGGDVHIDMTLTPRSCFVSMGEQGDAALLDL